MISFGDGEKIRNNTKVAEKFYPKRQRIQSSKYDSSSNRCSNASVSSVIKSCCCGTLSSGNRMYPARHSNDILQIQSTKGHIIQLKSSTTISIHHERQAEISRSTSLNSTVVSESSDSYPRVISVASTKFNDYTSVELPACGLTSCEGELVDRKQNQSFSSIVPESIYHKWNVSHKPNKVKRPVGRPRKYEKVNKPKRPVGRPRKDSQNPVMPLKLVNSCNMKNELPTVRVLKLDQDDVKPQFRKRGRPKGSCNIKRKKTENHSVLENGQKVVALSPIIQQKPNCCFLSPPSLIHRKDKMNLECLQNSEVLERKLEKSREYVIPRDKQELFGFILDEINRKIVRQKFDI